MFVWFCVLFVLCRPVYCLYVNVLFTTATGCLPNCSWQIYQYNNNSMIRGGAVVWNTALQAGRSRVRFPRLLLELFIDIFLPAALWPWGWLSIKQKWVPGIFPGGLRRPVRRADNLTTFTYQLSWNLGASISWNTQDLSRPVVGLLYTSFCGALNCF
jgi:hypothetical protein